MLATALLKASASIFSPTAAMVRCSLRVSASSPPSPPSQVDAPRAASSSASRHSRRTNPPPPPPPPPADPGRGPARGSLGSEPPQPPDEPPGPFDPGLAPFEIPLGRAVREHEPAHRIRAILIDDRLGIDGVLLGFGHLLDAPGLDRFARCPGDPAAVFLLDLVRVQPAVDAAIGLVGDHAL